MGGVLGQKVKNPYYIPQVNKLMIKLKRTSEIQHYAVINFDVAFVGIQLFV